MINKYGGKMDGAVGIPEEQLRKAASSAVCKINIDSDGRLVMTAMIRKALWRIRSSPIRASTWRRVTN